MGTITSANAALTLAVANVFSSPQTLQGWDVDNAFDIEMVDFAEDKIGVDGILSAGYIYNLVPMTLHLQADSASVSLFEQWFQAQVANQATYLATMGVSFPSIGKKYSLSSGVLKRGHLMSPMHKVLQPRTFTIDWPSSQITAGPQ